jgi:hypothetical protein
MGEECNSISFRICRSQLKELEEEKRKELRDLLLLPKTNLFHPQRSAVAEEPVVMTIATLLSTLVMPLAPQNGSPKSHTNYSMGKPFLVIQNTYLT